METQAPRYPEISLTVHEGCDRLVAMALVRGALRRHEERVEEFVGSVVFLPTTFDVLTESRNWVTIN